MGLNPVTGGLHRLKHDSAQPSKILLVIPPGDELEVSDDLAAQLAAASTHFVDPSTVPPSPRQIVKDANGVPTGWDDGSPLTDAQAADLGIYQDPADMPAPVEKPAKKAAAKKFAPKKPAKPAA